MPRIVEAKSECRGSLRSRCGSSRNNIIGPQNQYAPAFGEPNLDTAGARSVSGAGPRAFGTHPLLVAAHTLTSIPTHLLHIFSSFGIGGLPLRTIRVMRHLGSRCRHTVVSLDGIITAAQEIDPGVEAAIVPMAVDKHRPLANLFAFQRFLARTKPDLLMTYNWGAIEWAAVNRITSVCRHIHFEAGFSQAEATKQFRRRIIARRLALASSDFVVVPSQTLERIALDIWRLPRERVVYIPDGIDVARFARRIPLPYDSSQPQSEIIVGTVAPLRPEKNIARLIEAFGRIGDDLRLRLVIAGDGPERPRLEQLTTERGLGRRVTFLGHTSRPEEVLSEFDVFALSSDTEQIPNTVLEAMAVGLPIAAVDVGDVRMMVAAENRPYIVARNDVVGLSRSLSQLAAAPLVRHALGLVNRQQVEKYFRQEMMFQHYERLLFGGVAGCPIPSVVGDSSILPEHADTPPR